jgi:LmbE family N-acetylglucosaminyl deacetylase
MFYGNVKDVILERNIICVSPHYDDFLFFLGGYILELKEKGLLPTKRFMNISTFSRTNYQERDTQGNKDRSLERVKYATGIRFVEDLQCLDDLLGAHNYHYRVMGEEESQVRGKSFNEGEGEMEMAYGSYDTMEQSDKQILARMRRCIAELAVFRDTAIVLPLAMKGHIDHFIVREAGMQAMIELGPNAEATFYFAEDKPYAGLLDQEEMKDTMKFIKENDLQDIAFAHHPKEVLRLAFLHYPSQVDEVYNTGILARNEQLKKIYKTKNDCDRIFKLK